MSKGTIIGMLLIAVGGVMILFQKLSVLMEKSGDAIRLVDLADPSAFDWIDRMTFLKINALLDIIVTAPIYVLLFCLGAVFLIISGLKKD
jgi:hypothetical protein